MHYQHKIRLNKKTLKLNSNIKSNIKGNKNITLKSNNKKQLHPKKHIFYIVDCYVKSEKFLNKTFLYNHLVNAGLEPDPAMDIINKRLDMLLKKNGITKMQYCLREKKIKPFEIEKGLIKADIFFFYSTNPKLNQIFYKYQVYFSNVLSDEIYYYLDKDQFYNSILKFNSNHHDILKFFIKTFTFNKHSEFLFPGNYIIRPKKAFAGKDILYIHNKQDLNKAKEYYSTARDYKHNVYKYNEIAVSEIITDLSLFKGRKFHIRMYYLVSYIKGIVNSFLCHTGEIFTAEKEYNLDLPFSKEVHDTHGKHTDADYFFPQDMNSENLGIKITKEMLNEFIKKCKKICKCITRVFNANKDKILFDNQENGFYVYGLDILVKSNFEPVIIEININPGFENKTIANIDYMSKMLFDWINSVVIKPFCKYNNPYLAREDSTYIH